MKGVAISLTMLATTLGVSIACGASWVMGLITGYEVATNLQEKKDATPETEEEVM